MRLVLIAALAIPLISCCLCVIELGPFTIYYICDEWLEDGEDLVPIVGDLGGPVDEILSRTGGAPFPKGVGLAKAVAPEKATSDLTLSPTAVRAELALAKPEEARAVAASPISRI